MRVDQLAPSPGSNKAKRRVGRGIGGKGGKTAGAGTKGQQSRGRGKVARGFEGGQMPLKQRVPEAEGLQQPVPRRVQPGQPRPARRLRRVDGRSRRARRQGSRPQGRLRQGARPWRDHLARSTSRPTEFRRLLRRPSPPQAVASRCCRCPSSRVARRSRATSSPTADSHHYRRADKGVAVLSNLKNVFKVTDLRNKILFVMADDRPVPPGRRHPGARASTPTRSSSSRRASSRRAPSASSTCSPAARSAASRSSPSASCRTSPPASSCRCSASSSPSWRSCSKRARSGSARSPSTPGTSAIGISLMQATALTFIFGNGNGNAFFGAAQRLPRTSSCCPTACGRAATWSSSPSSPAPPC